MKSKTILIDCYNIKIELTKEKCGTISSDLKCSPKDYSYDEEVSASDFNMMMDALESMILAHAIAGIDVTSPAYIEGIETAVDACINKTNL